MTASICSAETGTETGRSVVATTVPLNEIPREWDGAWAELANGASEPSAFAESWFMRPAIDHLGGTSDGRMIAVWESDCLLGLLPVTIASRYGRLPVRHVENWIHYHCFFGTPLVRNGHEASFWRTALATLDDADWAPNFFHLVGIDPSGPVFSGLQEARRADIVHRSERALLCSDLDPAAYYERHVRQKKRKELRRLRSRLAELGTLAFEHLDDDGSVASWIQAFLELETSGWKGREGTALIDNASTRAFFENVVAAAHRAGKLDMLRLTLNGKAIAMLVNFMTPPGAFAFKIAFDENYARFSPGVLLKIANLEILNRPDIDWTDSCAVEDHPMINSLWAERREIVRVSVPLAGTRRKSMFHAARTVETLAAKLRGR
jgi:CelD/BcsL family acetyltransferase involved in cellulose biosynthesis